MIFSANILSLMMINNISLSNALILGIGTLLLLVISYFVFKKQATYNSELSENTNTTDLTIKAARLITVFGATIIPLGGIMYGVAFSANNIITWLHIILGVILFMLLGVSYLSKKAQNNVHHYMVFNFFVVLSFYQIIVYASSIEAYFMISLILALTTGGAIIHSMRVYVTMSIVVMCCSFAIALLVKQPHYNIILYLFGMLSSCSVGILILTVKLNLSEKLIFADTIVNKGSSLILAANKKGEIIYVSENINSILGYTPEEVLGNEWWKLTTVDNGDEIKTNLFESKEIKQTYNRLVKHKDGSFRWIQWNDKHYSTDLIFGIGTDITKEKEYQERFEYIVNNANDLIYTTDELGNFTFANQMVLTITERTVDEFVGLNFIDIVAPSHKKQVRLFYLLAVKNKTEKTYHEFPIINKSNKLVWVGQSVTNKFNNVTKKHEGTEVICRDINDRVAVQLQLDDTNRQLTLLNKIKEHILYANTIEEICSTILKTIISTANVTDLISVHINNDWQKKSYIYSSIKNDNNKINTFQNDYEDFQSMEIYFPNIIFEREIYLSKDDIELWQPLFFYNNESYKSALIVPIVFETKIIGFLNLFSNDENAYHTGDSFLLNDIANSVNAFITSYKQRQIIEKKNSLIEKNNQRLDILNKSKQSLLATDTIENVHKELILVLTSNIQNIDRVSTCEFYLNKNKAQLYYLNTLQNNTIDSKTITLSELSTLNTLQQNQIYYKPNFDNETDLTEDDKHWYGVGIRSVLCAPIIVNGELHGCINLLSAQPNNFDSTYILLIKEIVDSTSLTIEQIIYKNIINEKNKDITDNITYAKRIQDAIMPKLNLLQKSIPESFLLFSQKDVLGGDFYWFDHIEDKTYVVVGDCTGHGVSGSLLSILASDIIKQAVLELRLTDPGMILQHLNHKILSTLNQSTHNTTEENEIVDGLDISFAVINHQQHSVYFSGAMHTAYFTRNNELFEIKGNRKPIGASYHSEHDFFGTHIVSFKTGDEFYFLTDGYCDQFHFQTSKKFGKVKFRQLLLQITSLSTSEKYEALNSNHQQWKGNLEQTDDICLIGIKL